MSDEQECDKGEIYLTNVFNCFIKARVFAVLPVVIKVAHTQDISTYHVLLAFDTTKKLLTTADVETCLK